MKVLLVDDSKAVLRSFGELLASLPHVELLGSAGDVAGAMALIEALHPDVVVLDLELHDGEQGIELLRRLSQAPPQPRPQVIVLTNASKPRLRREALAAGAAAYFDKGDEFRLARDWIAARAAAPAMPPAAGRTPPR